MRDAGVEVVVGGIAIVNIGEIASYTSASRMLRLNCWVGLVV